MMVKCALFNRNALISAIQKGVAKKDCWYKILFIATLCFHRHAHVEGGSRTRTKLHVFIIPLGIFRPIPTGHKTITHQNEILWIQCIMSQIGHIHIYYSSTKKTGAKTHRLHYKKTLTRICHPPCLRLPHETSKIGRNISQLAPDVISMPIHQNPPTTYNHIHPFVTHTHKNTRGTHSFIEISPFLYLSGLNGLGGGVGRGR